MMHPIKRQILYHLILNPYLPYSKLKPENIEGNIFMYHLKNLIEEGYVDKRDDKKYELSLKGQGLADRFSLKNLAVRIQPKIVTLIVCKDKKGSYLFYKRNKQPFLGLIGFPYGKIHLGEKILDAAKRELKEKTGLYGELRQKGIVYLTTVRNGVFYTQMLCHIFVAEDLEGELLEKSEVGENFWSNLHLIDTDLLMPGIDDILKLLQADSEHLFFEELNCNFNN